MIDKSLSPKIWNTDQSDYFRECGCMLHKIDKEFSERLSKVAVYHIWVIDEVYLKAKKDWDFRSR